MIANEILISHSIYSNKGVFALLLGSGISRSAGIPTGWEIVLDLIQRIAFLQQAEYTTTPDKWFKEYFKEEPDYSNILEKLTYSQEERINLLRPYFESTEDEIGVGLKKPTIAHTQIAQLVKKGYIKVIITTNFDRLIENSLREIGIEPTVISNPNHVENVIPLIHNSITVIKINGDYLDTKFLNIKSELTSYDHRIDNLLKYVFENFGLLTCGWSGKWDLALNGLLQSSNKFRFSNFFTYINSYEEELKGVSKFRKGRLIKIISADKFFMEVHENVDALEKNELQHPLTKELSVARLKKYVVREEYKIQLYDLLKNQLELTYQIINNLDFPKPDSSLVKNRIEFFTGNLETLSSLLIEGVYWGKNYHYSIWINIIKKIANPVRNRSSWGFWTDLSYYPALYILYSIGISCIIKKDFSLLAEVFSIKISNSSSPEEDTFLILQVNSDIITEKDLKNILNVNHHFPMSELLYNSLKIYFENIVTIEKDYDDSFEYFEIIIALIYLKQSGENYTIRGRYIYKSWRVTNSVAKKKFEELQKEQLEFELIKQGVFENYSELLSYYQTLNKFIENWDRR